MDTKLETRAFPLIKEETFQEKEPVGAFPYPERFPDKKRKCSKQFIIFTAFKLFVKRGFTDVSVNDIVAYANVTKGGFYHYFKSKDELISNVFSCYICPYFENAIKSSEGEPPGINLPRAKIEGFIDKLADYEKYVKDLFHPEPVDATQFYFLVMEGIKKYAYISSYNNKFYKQAKKFIKEALCEGVSLGHLPGCLDAETAAMRILTTHEGIILLNVYNGSFPEKSDILCSFNEIWDSLATQSNDIKGEVIV